MVVGSEEKKMDRGKKRSYTHHFIAEYTQLVK